MSGKLKGFNASIQFGKVVKENTVVGLILSYGDSNLHLFPDSYYNKIINTVRGFFIENTKNCQRIFISWAKQMQFIFIQKISRDSFRFKVTGIKVTSDGGVLSFIPGISYPICKRMQVELSMPNIISLSYSHIKNRLYHGSAPPSQPRRK